MADSKINPWLLPLSWIYAGVTSLRNKLFDRGWLRSESFDVPTVCIGNLAVGGTGKTPHTEYLVRLLQGQGWQVAVLSRGYKRRSKGFVLATSATTADELGDEPFQIKQKFPDARVAVDANRCHGIKQLLATPMPPQVILLDDAFQHRRVKADVNILLTDYHRLWCDDTLLPAGCLRESADGSRRAQIVLITKCPKELKPIDYNILTKQLHLYPYQRLYFSTLRYGPLTPLFPELAQEAHPQPDATTHILLLSGIAHPETLAQEMQRYGATVTHLAYADHHAFTARDLNAIQARFEQLPQAHRLLITTEKDCARLLHHPHLSDTLKPYIYVQPIEIEILNNQQESFNQTIIRYVRTNSRNGRLS